MDDNDPDNVEMKPSPGTVTEETWRCPEEGCPLQSVPIMMTDIKTKGAPMCQLHPEPVAMVRA